MNLDEKQVTEFSKSEQAESYKTPKPVTNEIKKCGTKVCTQECVEQGTKRSYRDVLCGTKNSPRIPNTGLLNPVLHRLRTQNKNIKYHKNSG